MPDASRAPQYELAEKYRLALEKAIKPSTGHSASMGIYVNFPRLTTQVDLPADFHVLQPGRAGLL